MKSHLLIDLKSYEDHSDFKCTIHPDPAEASVALLRVLMQQDQLFTFFWETTRLAAASRGLIDAKEAGIPLSTLKGFGKQFTAVPFGVSTPLEETRRGLEAMKKRYAEEDYKEILDPLIQMHAKHSSAKENKAFLKVLNEVFPNYAEA